MKKVLVNNKNMGEKIEQTSQPEPQPEEEPQKEIVEKEEVFDISKFLIEPKTDYGDLILKTEQDSALEEWDKRSLFTSYASDLESALRGIIGYERISDKKCEEERQEALSYFKKKLKGKILINLGAGSYHAMINFAKESGVKVYIEVDKFFPENEDIPLNSSVDLSLGDKNENMQIVTVKSDMLDFLSRIPNESVCIVINGIDGDLIKNNEYHKALIKEFKRVIPNGEIVFGRNSTSLGLISQGVLKNTNEEEKENLQSFRPVRLEFLSNKWGIHANIFEKQ